MTFVSSQATGTLDGSRTSLAGDRRQITSHRFVPRDSLIN